MTNTPDMGGPQSPEEHTPSGDAVERMWRAISEGTRAAAPEPELVGAGADGLRKIADSIHYVPDGEGWTETALPGLRFKVLAEDRAADRRTTLLQLDPGAEFPRHRHHGLEECYVITGDLSSDDYTLLAGDYMRMTGGSEHAQQFTAAGCVAVLIGSCSDVLPLH